MRARAAFAAITALALAAGTSACSNPKSPAAPVVTLPTSAAPIAVGQAPVLVEMIRPAIAAVEKALGGPQHFFEVNATPTLVNIFVAEDNATKAVAYEYTAGTLGPAAAPVVASGPVFTASDVTFDETQVLALTTAQLPTSTILRFSVAGVSGGGASYLITVGSSLGSEFEVTVGPTGVVLSTSEDLAGTSPSSSGS